MGCRSILLLAASLVLITASAWGAADEAADRYRGILEELSLKSKSISPHELVNLAEKRFLEFIDRYPGTPEAANARFNLGRIFAQIGRYAEAVENLEGFLDAQVERKPEEATLARYMLAQSHLALERFDETEALFKEILESGSTNRKIVGMASRELARVKILRKLTIGSPAIDFSTVSSEGEKVTLSAFKGKVVLLDFWASWCAPCRQEMPNVKKVYEDYNGKGFEIIGISLDESREKFKGYVNMYALPWVQIFDGKGWMSRIGQLYAVNAIPATVLLDQQGNIRYKNVRGKELRRAVDALIDGE